MRLVYHNHFQAPMRSTVLYIVIVLTLIGTAQASVVTDPNETPEAEVQADVKEFKQDLEHAESKDLQNLEIYKQIRRVNTDGSYTVGYESDDGSFKIENRDALGNVKGTYGYIDANGETKRVSYIAQNSTANKKQIEDAQQAQNLKSNRTQYVTATTKRPSYLQQSTTISPTKQSVIQTIPRKRLVGQFGGLSQSPTAASLTSHQSNGFYVTPKVSDNSPIAESTTTVIYATSVPTAKPTIVVSPTPISSLQNRNFDQIVRPERQENDAGRKIQIFNARDTSTVKPVVEIENAKENEKNSFRGNNNYRRQLSNDKLFDRERESEATTASQQQIIYSHADDGEGSSIYGGSTAKPLYTSTSTSRIPAIVIAARQRANQLQQAINNGATTVATTRAPEKLYAKPPRNQDQNRNSVEQSTESTSENNFLTQSSQPIVQIPPNRGNQQQDHNEPVYYRRRPIPPQNFQQYPINRDQIRAGVNQNAIRNIGREPPLPLPSLSPKNNNNDRSEQFLRDSHLPPPSAEAQQQGFANFPDENLIIPPNLPPFRDPRKQSDHRQYNTQQEQDSEYDQQYFPNPNFIPRYNPNYGNDFLNKPLTAHDFERLLQYLVLRHQQLQQQTARIGYYPQSDLYRGGPPVPNIGQYLPYQQIPRPPIIDPGFYDPRSPYYRPSNQIRQYNEPDIAYQQAQNQIPEQQQPQQIGQFRRKPQNYYPTRYFTDTTGSYTKNEEHRYDDDRLLNTDEENLPSNVREELLYRMLMLAIRGESANVIQNSVNSDLNPIALSAGRNSHYTKKPVRSVQILGDD